MIRMALIRLAWVAVLAGSVAGQVPDTATLKGQVTDPSHAAVADADISLTSTRINFTRTTRSDTQGGFSLSGLPIGSYRLTIHKEGFADATREITLLAGTTAEVKTQLSVSPVQTQVQVTGAAGEVRGDEPQLGDRLGALQVEQTPLLSRRITYLPLLNAANRPAINQGDVFMNQNLFTTNGSGRRQTAWVLDGSTGNDSWGRQTIFTNVPQTAVQEMTVLENAFSAEYGATTGGVVNIVTKSGSSLLHGDILGMWRPDATAAKLSGFTAGTATSGNQVVSDSLGQIAASIGGPIPGTHDRTHFFFAGEYTRENRGSPVTSPLDPGVFVGHYAGWMTFLRLDQQLNQNNTLFLRANTDSFHDTNPNGTVGGNNLPNVDRIFRRRTYAVQLGETAVLAPSWLNSFHAQFQLASPITQFDPVVFGTQFVVPITAPGGGTFTSGTSQSALLLNRQYGFSDVVSWSRGRHQVRFGVDLVHAHNGGNSKEFGGPITLGQLTYKPCGVSVAFCESPTYLDNIANVAKYVQAFGNQDYTVDDTLWSLFVQDDIRVRPDLTLNLGLRYEQQTFTDARLNFAPRVGFAYDLRGRGRTVLRGGYGIYYSQVVDNAQANYALGDPGGGIITITLAPSDPQFPTSVSAVPFPAFPPGAPVPPLTIYIRPGRAAYYNQFLDTSLLKGYPDALLNPYSQQWTFGVEQQLGHHWVLAVDYLGSHTVKIVRPLDVDSPAPFVRTAQGQSRSSAVANCSRPLWVAYYAGLGMPCPTSSPFGVQPPYAVVTTDVNNGSMRYHALDVSLSHQAGRFAFLASYVYSHAIDNVDPDAPGGNPNDPNFTGDQEEGPAIFDQRHRFVVSGVYSLPKGFNVGGIATLASGLPFNIVTGTNNSGDTGATTDRPVVNGVVLGRNAGRGRPFYDVSPFVEKDFALGERFHLLGRVEAFNVFNHANFVGYNGTFGNGPTPPASLGTPLTGITNQLPARSLQFSARFVF